MNSLLVDALAAMNDHPEFHLNRGWRCRIYAALEKEGEDERVSKKRPGINGHNIHKYKRVFLSDADTGIGHHRRIKLARLCSILLIETWEQHHPDNFIPHLYLYATDRLLSGDLSIGDAVEILVQALHRKPLEIDQSVIAQQLGIDSPPIALYDFFHNRYTFPEGMKKPNADMPWENPGYLDAICHGVIETLSIADSDEEFTGQESVDDDDAADITEPVLSFSWPYAQEGREKEFWEWWLTVAVPYAYRSVPV